MLYTLLHNMARLPFATYYHYIANTLHYWPLLCRRLMEIFVAPARRRLVYYIYDINIPGCFSVIYDIQLRHIEKLSSFSYADGMQHTQHVLLLYITAGMLPLSIAAINRMLLTSAISCCLRRWRHICHYCFTLLLSRRHLYYFHCQRHYYFTYIHYEPLLCFHLLVIIICLRHAAATYAFIYLFAVI